MNVDKVASLVKNHYPDRPTDPDQLIVWMIIRSRRTAGLTESEFRKFDDLVVTRLPAILATWPERWLVSICDTYAENGVGVALVAAALRLVEKMARPSTNPAEFDQRVMNATRPDAHLAFARRIAALTDGQEHIRDLIARVFRHLAEDPHSVVGRFCSLKSGVLDEFDKHAKP